VAVNRIKELRKAKGVTQEELASVLCVQRPALSKYETGAVPLTDSTITILTDYFNVSADYLLGRTNDLAPATEKSPIVDDKALKFGLWGDTNIADDVLDEVKRFAQFAREQRKAKEDADGGSA